MVSKPCPTSLCGAFTEASLMASTSNLFLLNAIDDLYHWNAESLPVLLLGETTCDVRCFLQHQESLEHF